MTNSHPHSKPTPKTINYLKDLAMKTGQSFDWPTTQEQASKQIARLESVKRTSRADRRRETQQIRSDMATRRGGAAAVRDEEIGGYGSTASWAAGNE